MNTNEEVLEEVLEEVVEVEVVKPVVYEPISYVGVLKNRKAIMKTVDTGLDDWDEFVDEMFMRDHRFGTVFYPSSFRMIKAINDFLGEACVELFTEAFMKYTEEPVISLT